MSAHTYVTAQNWFQVITLARVPAKTAQETLPDLITIAQARQLSGDLWHNFQISPTPTNAPPYTLDAQDKPT